jgi:hypothetical protein
MNKKDSKYPNVNKNRKYYSKINRVVFLFHKSYIFTEKITNIIIAY